MKYNIELNKKNNQNTILIESKDENGVIKKRYIHSKYSPEKEGEEWAEKIFDESKKIYIIFGGGLLYHVEALMKLVNKNDKVVVIEPLLELSSSDIHKEIVENLKEFDNFNIILTNEQFDIINYLKIIISEFDLGKIKVDFLESYKNIFPNDYNIFLKSIKKLIRHIRLNENTMNYFSVEFTENIVSNSFCMAKANYIMEFKDAFKGETAIIVSAGPSLSKNIELLKNNEDKFLIISGGRTLKTLLDLNIIPHFVVSIDPSLENYRLFEPVIDSDVPLVTGWLNNKEIGRQYRGRKIFFNNSNIPGILDNQLFGEEIDNLPGGGSVATFQVSFAEYLGCKKIILIGQDLAYTENKFHSDLASDNKNEILDKDGLIKVEGNSEPYVYTSQVLEVYKDWFEHYAKGNKHIELINCTEGGAYIDGVIHKKLIEIIEDCRTYNKNYYEVIMKILGKEKDIFDLTFIEAIKQMMNDAEKVINLANRAVLIANRLKPDINKKCDLIELDKIDEKIKALETSTMPAAMLMQSELSIFKNLNIDETEDIINANKNFYTVVRDSYEKYKEIMIKEMQLYKL